MYNFKIFINFNQIKQSNELYHLFFIIFLLLNISEIYCEEIECKNNSVITNTNCFNELKFFNGKNYRSGHFAMNKKGDLIIEFSEENTRRRLFYGLKSDGGYYFSNEEATYELDITPVKISDSEEYLARYEAINLFVNLENDDTNEYLFSVSSFNSVVELHNLNSDNDTHYTWSAKNFFELAEDYILSFEYPLFEIKNTSTYILVLIPRKGSSCNDESDSYIIKKFKFTSYNTNGNQIIKTIVCNDNYFYRIISAFSMDDYNILVVFYVAKINDNSGKYVIKFYDYDLNEKNNTISLSEPPSNSNKEGVFFKSLYLKEKYAAFIFFSNDGTQKLNFHLKELKTDDSGYNFDNKITWNINDINFIPESGLGDFVKINDRRLVFISTEEFDYQNR